MVLFYVINFNDDKRKERMTSRFRKLDIDLHFVNPVQMGDVRIENTPLDKRTSAIMLQHLDSVRHFYENTTADYSIICEDDIHISKNLVSDLPEIIKNFQELGLDILLLGYLFPRQLHGNGYFPVLKDTGRYSFHGYPDDIWGSQMYLISRKHAKYLIDTFTIQFAIDHLEKIPYSPDWIITKYGKRAVITPMIAVEEGEDKSGNCGQTDFHRRCHQHNFNADIHI
jgi:hypothetical protein